MELVAPEFGDPISGRRIGRIVAKALLSPLDTISDCS